MYRANIAMMGQDWQQHKIIAVRETKSRTAFHMTDRILFFTELDGESAATGHEHRNHTL